MVVVVPAEHQLVARLPAGHLDLVDEPGVDQARQVAVQRGARHAVPRLAQAPQEVVDVEVSAHRQHVIDEGASLARHLEAMFRQVLREPFDRLHAPSPRGPDPALGIALVR